MLRQSIGRIKTPKTVDLKGKPLVLDRAYMRNDKYHELFVVTRLTNFSYTLQGEDGFSKQYEHCSIVGPKYLSPVTKGEVRERIKSYKVAIGVLEKSLAQTPPKCTNKSIIPDYVELDRVMDKTLKSIKGK